MEKNPVVARLENDLEGQPLFLGEKENRYWQLVERQDKGILTFAERDEMNEILKQAAKQVDKQAA